MKFIAMLLTSLFSVFSYCQDNFNDHSFDCQGVKIEMIYVEPGTFVMSKEDGENAKGEVPHKRRLLKPYYIGKYEVTNEQWCAIMDVSYAPSMHSKKARFPVENITWFRAMAFCERMNRYAPQGWHFTLPTEVQWEFAARGGNKSKGYKYSGDNDLNLVGWFHDNSSQTTHPVGLMRPNELGLHDMSGNVSEWCLDDYIRISNHNLRAEFSRPYRYSIFERFFPNTHMHRGGNYSSKAKNCRIATRKGLYFLCAIGFRLALVQD